MRDTVRRVLHTTRGRQRFNLEFSSKINQRGESDCYSSLDTGAQDIYHRMVDECFPGAGFIAEEGNVLIMPDDLSGVTFTADGIDGTKALEQQRSHGIGTMLAAVQGGLTIAAYVGDVCTGEIYGYHPDSTCVSRIVESGYAHKLGVSDLDLASQYLLLREHPNSYSPMVQKLTALGGDALFKGLQVFGGSIGIWMAQLWKGEFGAAVLAPQLANSPWDWCPVMGITERMGFRAHLLQGNQLVPYAPADMLSTHGYNHELIIVHERREQELRSWLELAASS